MKKTSRRAARRLTQKEMTAQLETLFTENSEQKFSTRDIFSALGCSTHPQRVLCCDILEDMVDADVITVKDGLYSLCLKNQVIENGTKDYSYHAQGKVVENTSENCLADDNSCKTDYDGTTSHVYICKSLILCKKGTG